MRSAVKLEHHGMLMHSQSGRQAGSVNAVVLCC